ncbi:MAG: DEAD/DEAH box helicase [Chitinophagia bacterium]|nr:DEAD/DEAH box helicase [Chitinophagia bacterium]
MLTDQFREQLLPLLGIPSFNDLQENTFRETQQHNDIILLAATGSGKTIGYLVPVLRAIKKNRPGIQALIIVPVRELAEQVAEVFRKMKTGLKVTTCYGGHSREAEAHNLTEPPALLISTPGRLCDHINTGVVNLDMVHTLVLDEFDKSLEMGFEEEMAYIANRVPETRRNILVSATDMEELPSFLAGINFHKLNYLPSGAQLPEQLILASLRTNTESKIHDLGCLINDVNGAPVIVFCNFREEVEKVTKALLEAGIAAIAYHGALEQDKRENALFVFRSKSANVLVTTDIASRGFDISNVALIVHYQLPQTREIFIHRNGRTARMNAGGRAVILLTGNEYLPEFAGTDIAQIEVPSGHNTPTKPEWTSLFFAGGKKEKINKVDLVGFLTQKGLLEKAEIGLLEVKDHHSFAAVAAHKARAVVNRVRGEKVKNQKIRIDIAK